jgi:hypothetical protein
MIVLLIGVATTVSPSVRAVVTGLMRSWFSDRTSYVTTTKQFIDNFAFGYIPEGFELVLHEDYETGSFHIYQNSDSLTLNIVMSTGKQVVNNENSTHYERVLNGRTADIYKSAESEYPNIVIIYDEPSGIIISITSEIDIDELIRIGECIN